MANNLSSRLTALEQLRGQSREAYSYVITPEEALLLVETSDPGAKAYIVSPGQAESNEAWAAQVATENRA